MTGSSFFKVVIGVLALGLTYGAAFGGGALYGRSSAPKSAVASDIVALPTATLPATGQGQPPVLNFTVDDVARLREQLAQRFGGQIPPALQGALDGFRDGGQLELPMGGLGAPPPGGQGQFFLGGPGAQPRGAGGIGAGAAGGPGAGATDAPSAGGTGAGATQRAAGVEGKITSISDTKMTVETAQGTVVVSIDATIPVQVTSSLPVGSLKAGDDVMVRGQRLADGTIRAVSITKPVSP